jgi:uncharacterized protein (DUF427 family)
VTYGILRHPEREPVLPGQESVWDYPRPPAVRAVTHDVRVLHRGVLLAHSPRPLQVLETAHAPGYYLPAEDVAMQLLEPNERRTVCEFKGVARYLDLVMGGLRVPDAAWTYPDPRPGYEALAGAVSFYPQRVERCEVDGERVIPLDSGFYGDWPTSRIAGPWKGTPGTEWW